MENIVHCERSIVAPDPPTSLELFVNVLKLPLQRHEGDEYYFSEKIEGTKRFGVWPLTQAAEACLGTTNWTKDRPVPQTSIEFEVADAESVGRDAGELEASGHVLFA